MRAEDTIFFPRYFLLKFRRDVSLMRILINTFLIGVIITAASVIAWQFLKPYVIQPYIINSAQTEEISEIEPDKIAENRDRIQSGIDTQVIPITDDIENTDSTGQSLADQSADNVPSEQNAETATETNTQNESFAHPDENIVYDPSAIESASDIPVNAVLNYDYMIGEIYVPDVGIHIPILEGLTNENLWLASATMKPNQVMGEGNYAIAGHYMLDKSLLFTPLENSREGQKVYITDKRTVYEYTIKSIRQMDPSNGHVINNSEGDGLVTLVTCSDPWGTARIIVRGELTKEYDIKEASDHLQQTFVGRTL